MPGDWWRIPLVAVAIAAGVGWSVAYGPPADMPGVSLGWPWLLHLERGVALLAVGAAALLVGVRATRGRFPAKFGQLEYSNEELERQNRATIDAHERRLGAIEDVLDDLVEVGWRR